jgi:hypothetical protein
MRFLERTASCGTMSPGARSRIRRLTAHIGATGADGPRQYHRLKPHWRTGPDPRLAGTGRKIGTRRPLRCSRPLPSSTNSRASQARVRRMPGHRRSRNIRWPQPARSSPGRPSQRKHDGPPRCERSDWPIHASPRDFRGIRAVCWAREEGAGASLGRAPARARGWAREPATLSLEKQAFLAQSARLIQEHQAFCPSAVP